MILIKDKDNNTSFLEYTGNISEKHAVLRVLAQYRDHVKRINTDKWIIPNEIISLLETAQSFLTIVALWL